METYARILPLLRRFFTKSALVSAGTCIFFMTCHVPLANGQTLLVKVGPKSQKMSATALLQSANVTIVDVPNDPVYHRDMKYRAIPITSIIENLTQTAALTFISLDGFVVTIPASELSNTKEVRAWLAIEEPSKPWPARPGQVDAGPFYLVWTGQKVGEVPREHWAYQVKEVRDSLMVKQRFPGLVPSAVAPASVIHGFKLFSVQCLACHKVNQTGDSDLGPDLGYPYSPTEYMAADFLKRYIRNPQNVRKWSGSKMQGFPKADLSDSDLEAIIAYLAYTTTTRSQPSR